MTQATSTAAQIAAMGTTLGADVLAACRTLFNSEQSALAAQVPVAAADCAYGPHDRQRLDIYGGGKAAPVVLFIHGGGFVQGDKGGAEHWANAAVGRWAATQGFVGAVMNYRLAPDHRWPAGGEDVLAAIDWLAANAACHGGDPARIVVMGTSAGAVHVATALQLRPGLAVRGAVLLSGLYGHTALEGRDSSYYSETDEYALQIPRDAIAATAVPLFVACAQFDPPRFQAEFLGLMRDRLDRHGMMARSYIASGHNHYSLAMHLGTSDCRLADEIAGFVDETCA